MHFSHDKIIIGKCSLCGGVVSVPRVWWGVGSPPKSCETCSAIKDETVNLPVIPMKPKNNNNWNNFNQTISNKKLQKEIYE